MVDSCCAPGCQNSRLKGRKRAYYRIPRDPERRQRWINAIKRARAQQKKTDRWEPSSNGLRLCSDHFISGKKSDNPLSPDYVPSIFRNVTSPEKLRARIQLDVFNSRQKGRLQGTEQAKKVSAASVIPPTDSPQDSNEPQPGPDDHDDPAAPCASEECKRRIKSLHVECKALRDENKLLKEKMNRIGLNEMNLEKNDKKVNILTGLPTFSLLMTVFQSVSPFLKQKSGLTLFQQYMLTLFKLKMNLSFDFLAYYFGIDSATVTKLFKHCISVMYCKLVPSLVMWPNRDSLRLSLPCAFRNSTFEKTICIIDCFKIFIEKPSHLLDSDQCYSTSKSRHTMKYLIAICPLGSICFISDGWGGCTSDKFIAEQSSFRSHLLPGDLVLADQSFNARGSTHSETKITAFTRGKKQLKSVILENSRCLASLGINIERVIGTLRHKYTVLQGTVPKDFTEIDSENDVTYLDKIVKVCCALTNVSECVVLFV